MQNFLKIFFKTFKHLFFLLEALAGIQNAHITENRKKGEKFPCNEIIRVEIRLKSLKSFLLRFLYA